ncbi:type II toxin-antitoxin system VapC family toxin [Candidatus Woesearchaeota archaeon]|nr:type II toxin-antitoxin system VapC family toxin [Candidatus Woesearchaeota archaeon]
MNYCLDTNVIVDIFRGDISLTKQFQELSEEDVSLCGPVLAELYKGAYLSSKQEESIRFIQSFIQDMGWQEFNKTASQLYGNFFAELKIKGKPTQDSDLMIASIAIAHNATLITRNGKHFSHIPQLKIVVW